MELVQACTSGDVQALYEILSQQQSQEELALMVNLTTEGGVTLLMHTIIGAGSLDPSLNSRHVECCSLLIQGGGDLETADTTHGRTASHWAVYYHRDDILTLLIQAGCDMSCPDFSGTSPFHLILQESATTCLAVALQLLPMEILHIPHPQFLLPLLHAVQRGNAEACRLLMEAGADVNQADIGTGRTALHIATELNDRNLVDFLIGCGGLLDTVDRRGLTPLHLACIVEGEDALEAIVRRVGGGDVLDIQDERGLTPLMHACLYGNLGSVRLLLRNKVDVMIQDLESKHSLHYAAESSSQTAHECVQLIIKKNKRLLDIKDGLGRTPLHTCAMSGTVESLDLLLSSGCSLDTKDSSHRGPVHWAAVSGNPTVLSKLLELGAPVDDFDTLGSTPLHYACQQSNEPGVEEYTEENINRSQLVQQCVGVLLRGGADVHQRDGQGLQPLHCALQLHNNIQCCHLLLEHGADPYAKTEAEEITGLHLAAKRGVAESCQFLLDKTGGQLGTIVDKEGQTAMHHAMGSGIIECVDYLLQAGLSPNHSNNQQRTPAHLAASIGFAHCLELLQSYGANLAVTSADGATPLHEAAANGHSDVVEFLVSSGAVPIDKGAESNQTTPLHYAVQGGHEDCVQMLLDWGAKVNVISKSEEGEQLSPLDLCIEDTPIHNLLTQHGALPGTDIAKQQAHTADSAIQRDEVDGTPEVGGANEETISIPSVRPTTPSRRSFVGDPVFEDDHEDYTASPKQPSRVPTPATPPLPPADLKKPSPGILKKAFVMLRKRPSKQTQDSILSSAVGFYAAQATLLAAAVIGTPLGDKVREVAEKVATDTAEELKKAAVQHEGEFPELTWLHEETDGPSTPTPTPPPPTPPPPTPPPPVPKVQEDPYDRRMRKAKAQLDMKKSPAFLAVEELVKAQNTHMRLKRRFQEDLLQEDIKKRQENFDEEEMKAKNASEKVMKKMMERMQKAEAESEEMNETIEKQLLHARRENEKLSALMGEMGINPRPTVAQWLQRKQLQQKSTLQDSLIKWDRDRQHREAAILVEQAVLSQRAIKHAAWGAKKDLSSKIKAMKTSPYKADQAKLLQQTQLKAPPTSKDVPDGRARGVRRLQPSPTSPRKIAAGPPSVKPAIVLPTPSGFRRIRDPSALTTSPRKRTSTEPLLWKVGEDYVVEDKLSFPRSPSPAYLRAIGPKSVHAERTLHFLSPEEYRAAKAADRAMKKQLIQKYGSSPALPVEGRRSPRKSAIVIRSLDFEQKRGLIRRGVSFNRSPPTGTRYHSLADSIGGRGLHDPQRPTGSSDGNTPILTMSVLDPSQVVSLTPPPVTAS